MRTATTIWKVMELVRSEIPTMRITGPDSLEAYAKGTIAAHMLKVGFSIFMLVLFTVLSVFFLTPELILVGIAVAYAVGFMSFLFELYANSLAQRYVGPTTLNNPELMKEAEKNKVRAFLLMLVWPFYAIYAVKYLLYPPVIPTGLAKMLEQEAQNNN